MPTPFNPNPFTNSLKLNLPVPITKKVIGIQKLIFVLVMCASSLFSAAQINRWDGSSDSRWNTAANWSLNLVPTGAHDVVIDINAAIDVNTAPPDLRSLTISGNATVSFTCSGASRTINITNTGTGFSIAGGSSLTLIGSNAGGGRSMNLAFAAAGTSCSIAGDLILNPTGAGSSLNTTNSNTIVTGTIINNGGTITSTAANLSFSGGGTYVHAINGSIVPTATWNVTSNCNITGITNLAPTGLTQAFGNFLWNCAAHSASINLNSTLTTINGNFTVNQGGNPSGMRVSDPLILSANSNLTLNVGGNVTVSNTGVAAWLALTSGTANVTMNVGGNFNMSGTTTFFDYAIGANLNSLVVNVTGNLNIAGGLFDWAFTPTIGSNFSVLNLNGNFTLSGTGAMITSVASTTIPNGKLVFNRAGIQSMSVSTPGNLVYTNFEVSATSTLDLLSTINLTSQAAPFGIKGGRFEVLGGGILDLNTFQILSSSGGAAGVNNSITINAGAKVITANANGLQNTTTGSVSTSIATRTYNSGADYEFQGATTGTFVTTPVAATARDIIVNNTAGNVILNQPMAVTQTLNFISGKLNIGIHTFTVNSTASITGYNSSRYLITDPTTSNNGRLRQNGLTTAARVFPIGTVTNYLPVTITPVTAGSDFSLNVFRSTTIDGLPGGTAFGNRTHQVDAVWWIDQVTGSSNAVLYFDWQTDALEGTVFTALSSSPNQIGIWRKPGASWLLAAGASGVNYVSDNSANFIYNTGTISGWGVPGTGYPYIIGNIVTLPSNITLLSAAKSANGAILNWDISIADEIDHFNVEKSTDGNNFTTIGTVKASGSMKYSFADALLSNGNNYYRIKVFGKKGDVSYSYVVSLDNNGKNEIELFGNPVQSQLSFLHPASAKATYQITDLSGRVVATGNIAVNAVVTTIQINTLPAGQYVLVFTDRQAQLTSTFVKQ